MEDEWSLDMFDNIENAILDDSFILSNICYTHYYFVDPDTIEGSIISTSIRVYPYNGKWIKRVITKYTNSNFYEREIDDAIINNIEKNTDLRKLNNSYSIDDKYVEKFEIIYNSVYKIVGDVTVSIKDVDYIRNILTVNDILLEEKKKVSGLL